MISIAKGTANAVTVTLTEVGTASHYLFQFTSKVTNESVYCVADDTSPYQQRYNRFTITETANPDATDAEVEMNPTGQWEYFIYANTNGTNLNPSGLTLLEQGMCIVSGTSTTIPTYAGQDDTFVAYE